MDILELVDYLNEKIKGKCNRSVYVLLGDYICGFSISEDKDGNLTIELKGVRS